MSKPTDDDAPPLPPWRRPTRRMFVTLLGAAAAAFALPKVASTKSTRSLPGKTRWIGHC